MQVVPEWHIVGRPRIDLGQFCGRSHAGRASNIYFVHNYYDSVQNKILESDIYMCYKK